MPATWTPPAVPTALDWAIVDGSDTVTSRRTDDVAGTLSIVDTAAAVVQPGAVLNIAGDAEVTSTAAMPLNLKMKFYIRN